MRREFTKISFSVFFTLAFVLILPGVVIAQNGSLYFSPSSGQVATGQTFSTVVRVNTGGTAINAIEGSVVFDEQKLSVVSVSKSGSLLSIWAEEPKFSNAEGTVEFAGGIPTPGYSGSNGLVLTITFRAKTSVTGSADITLVSGGILANDGYGTNILSSLGRATYNFNSQASQPTPEIKPQVSTAPSSGDNDSRLAIKSTTHSDQERWYSSKDPAFKWDLPAGTTQILLVLSKRANSPPIISYSPPITEKVLTDIEDGSWYLNGQLKNSSGTSPISSFRFNIDTQAPENFDIVRLDPEDETNPQPKLLFESSDKTSGLDRYEIKIGADEWIKIEPSLAGRPYAMPLQKYGEYPVEIKAFDKAGNSSSAKIAVKIKAIKAPTVTEMTKEIKEGIPAIIRGTAEPGMKVIAEFTKIGYKINVISSAHAQEISENRYVYETIADSYGNWSLEINDLPSGRYEFRIFAQDNRLAVSESTGRTDIRVRGGMFDWALRLFDKFIDILSSGGLFIAFILALIGLVLAIIELLKLKTRHWLKPIIDYLVVARVQKKSSNQLEHIIKDIEQEIKFLRSIAKRRKLGPEEHYLKSKMEQYLKALKKQSF